MATNGGRKSTHSLRVSDHQFWIEGISVIGDQPPTARLVEQIDEIESTISVETITAWGTIAVTIDHRNQMPAFAAPGFETDIESHGELTLTTVDGDQRISISAPPGLLRMRVVRTREPSQAHTEAIEIQLWPTSVLSDAEVLTPENSGVVLIERTVREERENIRSKGLAASERIGGELDRYSTSQLSESLGTAEASFTFTDPQVDSTFRRIAAMSGLWGAKIGAFPAMVGNAIILPLQPGSKAHRITGSYSDIRITWTVIEPVTHVRMRWDWLEPGWSFEDFDSIAARIESTLDIRLQRESNGVVTILLEQSQVPVSWIPDLIAYWHWQFATAVSTKGV